MVARRVALPLLPVEVDAERRDRGVSLEEWLAAPAAPLTREECEDGPRPCPHLRCKFHVGLRGDGSFTCVLDFAALPDEERTYERIAAALGVVQEDVVRTVTRVEKRNRRDAPKVTRARELAYVLGILRRHA